MKKTLVILQKEIMAVHPMERRCVIQHRFKIEVLFCSLKMMLQLQNSEDGSNKVFVCSCVEKYVDNIYIYI